MKTIPNIIHFIFGLSPDFGGRPFSFFHYMAIKSAFEVNKPDKIYFLCAYEPQSEWFEKSRPYLDIQRITPPADIFGNKLNHYAHQADIIRLERLMEYGGIYLDLDTICVKPFAPLLQNDFVIGEEYFFWNNEETGVTERHLKGLCNAVMLSKPNSSFLKRWYETYKDFRSKGKDEFWAEHSVIIPGKLSKLYRDELFIVEEDAFFSPSYDDEGLQNMFVKKKLFPNAFVHHLWENVAWEYLQKITPDYVMKNDNTYNEIAKRFLSECDI